MIVPPCGKFCPERHVGCHSTCEKYRKYKVEKEKERKQRYIHNDIVDYTVKQLLKQFKK